MKNALVSLLAGALIGALAGCGQSAPSDVSARDNSAPPPGPISCPSGGDLAAAADLVPGLLPDEATMQAWEEFMVAQGPRFTGSPALRHWHDFIADKLAAAGLDVQREPVPIAWWNHRKWSLKLIENGVETDVPVASYFPYSGHTPEGGIVADVIDAGNGTAQLALAGGKIAFYEENQLPATAAIFFAVATYVQDDRHTILPTTSYKRASTSFLTPQESSVTTQDASSLSNAKRAGAVGAIISYEASFENAEGQYTPFLTSPAKSNGIPALYVDRKTGDMIKAKLASGAVQARLELVVDEYPADTTDDIVATLPGTTDEVMIVNSHSDGTSASEENGGIGVVALAQYFASLPKSCRARTMVFTLNPGHFNNGIGGETARFIKNHPDLMARAVASVTIEHLGQMEWLDDEKGFHATGEVEPGALFGSANVVQLLMTNAVRAEQLDRSFVMRPYGVIYFGVGSPLNAAGVPNAAYITGPNQMLSFAHNQHLDKVNYARMAAEVRTMARVAASMDATDKATLCAGMWSESPDKPTGCTPLPPGP